MQHDIACLSLIKNRYPSLVNSEKKIADFILQKPQAVLDMTALDLSRAVGVSKSNIVRFCQHLGFSGYSKFKIYFASDIGSSNQTRHANTADSAYDDITAVNKVFSTSIKTLEDTRRMLNATQFTKAVQMLEKARRIEFYGVGTSASLAIDSYYRFMRIGLPAYYATDPHISRVSASMLGHDCVAVGISHTGRTVDTLETLKIAKKAGVFTIAITSYGNSPISQIADITLTIYSDETLFPIEAVAARIAHIALLDALCVALSVRKPEKSRENTLHMKTLLEGLRAPYK